MKSNMHNGASKFHFQRARELRNDATHAETVLWGFLKTKPWGYKFRRQHPYATFILDFYCHSLKIVIEVDGSIHNLPDIQAYDIERQKLLENDGLTVIRFSNDMVEKSLELVIKQIENLVIQKKDGTKEK